MGGGECLQRLFWFLGDAFECQHLLGSPGDLAKMHIGKLLPRQGPLGLGVLSSWDADTVGNLQDKTSLHVGVAWVQGPTCTLCCNCPGTWANTCMHTHMRTRTRTCTHTEDPLWHNILFCIYLGQSRCFPGPCQCLF